MKSRKSLVIHATLNAFILPGSARMDGATGVVGRLSPCIRYGFAVLAAGFSWHF